MFVGRNKTVIGVTPLVTGELSFDLTNPQNTEIGMNSIDASDLTTDHNRRNRAIRRFVLKSEQDAFRFIIFVPTNIIGLPESVNVGDNFDVQITGDLTILETTLETTFDVNITISSETEFKGLGSTIIFHPDFKLDIPKVPSVASVEEEVRLEIEFVAVSGG